MILIDSLFLHWELRIQLKDFNVTFLKIIRNFLFYQKIGISDDHHDNQRSPNQTKKVPDKIIFKILGHLYKQTQKKNTNSTTTTSYVKITISKLFITSSKINNMKKNLYIRKQQMLCVFYVCQRIAK